MAFLSRCYLRVADLGVEEHRAHLADVLDEDLWNQLVTTYSKLEFERTLAKDLLLDTQLPDAMIEAMKHTAIELETLYRALGGGDGQLGDISKLVIEPRKTK